MWLLCGLGVFLRNIATGLDEIGYAYMSDIVVGLHLMDDSPVDSRLDCSLQDANKTIFTIVRILLKMCTWRVTSKVCVGVWERKCMTKLKVCQIINRHHT